MTMLFKECSPRHGIRSEEEDIVVAVDADNGRLLHYQQVHDGIDLPLVRSRPHQCHAPNVLPRFSFPFIPFSDWPTLCVAQNVVTERAAARVHYNLLDSHVAICAPQLLVVFADNFDYQEMAHLIKGVMERDEVSSAARAGQGSLRQGKEPAG